MKGEVALQRTSRFHIGASLFLPLSSRPALHSPALLREQSGTRCHLITTRSGSRRYSRLPHSGPARGEPCDDAWVRPINAMRECVGSAKRK